MKTLMQLHHHFQLTPWQLTSRQLGWIGAREAAAAVNVRFASVRACARAGDPVRAAI